LNFVIILQVVVAALVTIVTTLEPSHKVSNFMQRFGFDCDHNLTMTFPRLASLLEYWGL
jgi:hypothetical protein